jgi:hypothetical protein
MRAKRAVAIDDGAEHCTAVARERRDDLLTDERNAQPHIASVPTLAGIHGGRTSREFLKSDASQMTAQCQSIPS